MTQQSMAWASRNQLAVPKTQPVVEDASPPASRCLTLKELGSRGPNRVHVARLVGVEGGPFDKVNEQIGPRQLFFLFLLFQSRQSMEADGTYWTVVAETKATELFKEWVSRGYLKNAGEDEDKLERRVTKNWREFVGQLSKVKGLQGLFNFFPPPLTKDSEKVYAIQLRDHQMKVMLPDIDDLLGGLARS